MALASKIKMGSASILRARLHGGGDGAALLVAKDVEDDGATDGGGAGNDIHFVRVFEGVAIEADDDVVGAQPGVGGGGLGDDFVDGDADATGADLDHDFVHGDAEEAGGDGFFFDDGVEGNACFVGGDGESDALPGVDL